MMNDEMMKEFLKMVAEKLEREEGREQQMPSGEFEIAPKDILTDFKIFANELYQGVACDGEDEDSLIVDFANGQRFRIIVKEIKLRLLDN